MWIFQFVLHLAILGDLSDGVANESPTADALLPEHIRTVIAGLDDPDFQNREAAAEKLFSMGQDAVYPLTFSAEYGSPEASIRAFDVLQRLYRGDHEPTSEAVESAFTTLKHADNLAVAARTIQNLENNSDMRQERAIAQFERFGGIINYWDSTSPRPQPMRSKFQYFTLGRNWSGGDAGLQLLGRIDELRNSPTVLYVIKGVKVSQQSIQNLRAELPFIDVRDRGPARLGVMSDETQQFGGVVIREVELNSGADRAGLKTRDVILRIDGIPINSFESMVNIIDKKVHGSKISVIFLRGAKIQEVSAELQPRLGIIPDETQQFGGCYVSEVDTDSGAERAGLRARDVILKIDGKPISNFQSLVDIVGTKEPGDKVSVIFLRGDKVEEVSAELKPWNKSSRAIGGGVMPQKEVNPPAAEGNLDTKDNRKGDEPRFEPKPSSRPK